MYHKVKRRIISLKNRVPIKGQEQNSKFYDKMFLQHNHWKKHYTASSYYPAWTIIVDRISRAGTKSVLDIGCGPGQFAAFLKDKGIRDYIGIDFSPERIKQAKNACPDFNFTEGDVYKTDIFDVCGYDTVVCLEFLEHVEKDLEILDRLRSGVKFFGTVPNFPGIQHVRCFKNSQEVRERYSKKFKEVSVDTHLANNNGKKFFIIEGVTI